MGDYAGQHHIVSKKLTPEPGTPELDIASRVLTVDQAVKDLDLFAKAQDNNDKVIICTTHLWKRDFLTVCSIPPTCKILMACYRTHGVALIRDVIYVCEPTVWRYTVEPPSSQHTDSKFRRGDFLGPGYRSLVGIFPRWVEVINRDLYVDRLVYEKNGAAEGNLSALSFSITKVNISSTSIEQKRCKGEIYWTEMDMAPKSKRQVCFWVLGEGGGGGRVMGEGWGWEK